MADAKISAFTTTTTLTNLFLAGYIGPSNRKLDAGTYLQPKSVDLTAIAALTSAANKFPYSTGPGLWALADLAPFARSYLDDADAPAVLATLGVTGVHEIWLPGSAFYPRTTAGASAHTQELTTNKVMLKGYAFDTATAEGVQIAIAMPKAYNNATIGFRVYWTAASGSGGVVWSMRALAVSDDDAMDASWGTVQTVTDTLITANDMHVTSVSTPFTVAGTPATGDMIFFEVARVPGDASDTLTVDAICLGVKLTIATTQGNDA